MLRAPLRLVPSSAIVRVRSGINQGMRWIVGAGIHGCWLGYYEHEKQEVIAGLLEPGMKVFDVGANAGFYTLASARRVAPGGHVWAFEPLADNVCALRRHVALNGLTNVTVVQAAASDRSGVAGFLEGANRSAGRLADESAYLVPTVSLDEFCGAHRLEPPDLVKIDVEGAEHRVLEGARHMLSKGRTVVLLALHGAEQEARCLALLRQLRYRAVYLDGSEADDSPLRSDELIAIPPGSRVRYAPPDMDRHGE